MDPVRDLRGLTADCASQFIGSLDERPIPPRASVDELRALQVLVRFGNDELTRATVAAVQEDGTCWLSGTVWQRKAAMRISVSNWRTSDDDVEHSAHAILKAAAVAAPSRAL